MEDGFAELRHQYPRALPTRMSEGGVIVENEMVNRCVRLALTRQQRDHWVVARLTWLAEDAVAFSKNQGGRSSLSQVQRLLTH